MRTLLLLIIYGLLLGCSCSRKVYVPVERVEIRSDTLRMLSLRVDSVVTHDSVVIRQRGDTVYQTVVRWRDRTRTVTDTVLKVRTDSVSVPHVVTVPAAISWKQRFEIGLSSIGILLLLISLAVIGDTVLKKIRS